RASNVRLLLAFVSVALLAPAFSVSMSGHRPVTPTVPGAEACTALGVEKVAGVATLTATYDAGSAAQPAHCVVRGSAAPRTGADGKKHETRFPLRPPTSRSGPVPTH